MTNLEQYYSIINFRKHNPLPEDEYGEKHHIKPRSIYPELKNDKDNIVRLSASEHFLCHFYLWKYYRDELKDKINAKKMCYAFCMMKRAIALSNDIESMSKLYQEVREEMRMIETGKVIKEETRKKLSVSSKGRHPSEETIQKLRESNIGKKHNLSEQGRKKISDVFRNNKFSIGRKATDDSKKRMSVAQRNSKFQNDTKIKQLWQKKNCKVIEQYSLDGILVKRFNSLREVLRETGFDRRCVLRHSQNGTEYKGYFWKQI